MTTTVTVSGVMSVPYRHALPVWTEVWDPTLDHYVWHVGDEYFWGQGTQPYSFSFNVTTTITIPDESVAEEPADSGVLASIGHDEVETRKHLSQNPLPGRRLNVRNPSTADGRFDGDGSLLYRGGRPHGGVDIAAPVGTDVMAAGDGNAKVLVSRGYGNLVEIYHGDGVVTRYAHLGSLAVSDDASVSAGDIIGTVGRTGNVPLGATPHLHFEVVTKNARIDPADYFDWEP